LLEMILVVMLTWVSELPCLSDARSRPGLADDSGCPRSSLRIVKTSEAVRVQNAVSEWPMAARRRFRGRHHGA